jgi:hypothetical protein
MPIIVHVPLKQKMCPTGSLRTGDGGVGRRGPHVAMQAAAIYPLLQVDTLMRYKECSPSCPWCFASFLRATSTISCSSCCHPCFRPCQPLPRHDERCPRRPSVRGA